MSMDLRELKPGDEIAVLSAAGILIEMAVVERIGPNLIHLRDGRYYSIQTGIGLNSATTIKLPTQAKP